MVFLVANSIDVVVVLVLLIRIELWLGLFVLVAMVPLLVCTRRFELRYSRDARRAQDLTGDLRHHGRGVRARHPGDQVLRSAPAHAGRRSAPTPRGCAAPN